MLRDAGRCSWQPRVYDGISVRWPRRVWRWLSHVWAQFGHTGSGGLRLRVRVWLTRLVCRCESLKFPISVKSDIHLILGLENTPNFFRRGGLLTRDTSQRSGMRKPSGCARSFHPWLRSMSRDSAERARLPPIGLKVVSKLAKRDRHRCHSECYDLCAIGGRVLHIDNGSGAARGRINHWRRHVLATLRHAAVTNVVRSFASRGS